MATVRLSDAIVPPVYLSYGAVNTPESSAFFRSGVVARNAMLDAFATGPGKVIDIPFWRDLDANEEPNYSNDDPDDLATPGKIGSGEMIARKSFLNKSYADMDLVAELTGSDPMRQIRNRFGTYWQRQWQRRIVAMAVGVMKANVANNSSDMTLRISIADGNAATASNVFSRSAFVSAAFTLGDEVGAIRAIAVHSVVYKRMTDNDDIDFIPDSQGQLTVPTFMGRTVIVDDGCPVEAGGISGYIYTSILFGAGVFGYGEGTPEVPMWVKREEQAGHGGGMEEIGERKTWLIHPMGHQWIEGTIAGFSPALSELALAAHWTRVVPRKNVPLAFLRTNG